MKNIWQHERDFDKSCFGSKYLCYSTKSSLVISLLKTIANGNFRCAYRIAMGSYSFVWKENRLYLNIACLIPESSMETIDEILTQFL